MLPQRRDGKDSIRLRFDGSRSSARAVGRSPSRSTLSRIRARKSDRSLFNLRARARARGTSEEEWAAAVGADLGRAIGDPRFPNFAALLTAPPEAQPHTMMESFDFGLQRLLDGIELYIKSTTARAGALS